MEKKFEICSRYTEETFAEFAEFHCKQIQGVAYLRYLGWFMIWASIWFYYTSPTMDFVDFLLNPGLWLSLLFIFMSYWIPGNTAKQLYKKYKAGNGLENTITFYEDRVVFRTQAAEASYFYKQLYKCYETEKYFYVYVKRSMAQVIGKADFVCGSPDDLRAFFQQRTDVKLVRKRF